MIGIFEYMTRLGFGTMKRAPLYLREIRSRPCLLCGSTRAVEAHHEGPRGLGKKAPDWLAVPLCRECHAARHDGKVPDTYAAAVYSAQVQYLSWEIVKNRPAMRPFDSEFFGFVVSCGICGGGVPQRNPLKMVPMCYECAGKIGAKNHDFAFEFGLGNFRDVSEDVKHIRTLQVFILAAVAEKSRRK